MGIQGLLPSLKSIQRKAHLREFTGKRIGIDGSCWLHAGAYSCAMELAKGIRTDKYLHYCLKKLKTLQYFGIQPIFVFDGGRLPMKSQTEKDRRNMRDQSKVQADIYWNEGNYAQADRKYREAVKLNFEMVHRFIMELKQMNVKFVVAPYEADAQLAYMYKEQMIDIVMTEDSDLLAFGVQRVLYKVGPDGYGYEINLDNIQEATELNFRGFDIDHLLTTCILSGCDYLPSIKGIGFKTAQRLVAEYSSITHIINKFKMDGKFLIPKDYEQNFERAFLTFKFQVVYCPNRKMCVHLNEINDNQKYTQIKNYVDLNFLGRVVEEKIAKEIAEGLINPTTHELIKVNENVRTALTNITHGRAQKQVQTAINQSSMDRYLKKPLKTPENKVEAKINPPSLHIIEHINKFITTNFKFKQGSQNSTKEEKRSITEKEKGSPIISRSNELIEDTSEVFQSNAEYPANNKPTRKRGRYELERDTNESSELLIEELNPKKRLKVNKNNILCPGDEREIESLVGKVSPRGNKIITYLLAKSKENKMNKRENSNKEENENPNRIAKREGSWVNMDNREALRGMNDHRQQMEDSMKQLRMQINNNKKCNLQEENKSKGNEELANIFHKFKHQPRKPFIPPSSTTRKIGEVKVEQENTNTNKSYLKKSSGELFQMGTAKLIKKGSSNTKFTSATNQFFLNKSKKGTTTSGQGIETILNKRFTGNSWRK